MDNLKDLIVLRKQLIDDIEKMKKENINSVKNAFIKEQELNMTKRKYFNFIRRKSNLKTKKNRIILTSIIFLITIILTLLASVIASSFLSNIINMIIFKIAANMLVLGELLFSVSIISKSILKYNETKNYIDYNLEDIKVKLVSLENDLKTLDKEHISYCRDLNKKENIKTDIDNTLNDKLFKEKTIINKSEAILDKTKNRERVRIP